MTRIDISAAVFDAVDRGEPITILGRKYVPAYSDSPTSRPIGDQTNAVPCGCGQFRFSRNWQTITDGTMTHRPGQPCYDVSHP